MSSILEDIGDNIEVKKNKDVFIKWTLILLPYIIAGAFFIGGTWVTLKINFEKYEKGQTDNVNNINSIKKDVKDVDIKVEKLNQRIDNTNQRIDNIFIQDINHHHNN